MHFSLRSDQKVPQRRLHRWTWKNYGRCSWPEGTYTCPSLPCARFHATVDCVYLQNGEVCAFSSAQCKLTLKWHINSCVMTVTTSKYFWDFILEWSLHTWAHTVNSRWIFKFICCIVSGWESTEAGVWWMRCKPQSPTYQLWEFCAFLKPLLMCLLIGILVPSNSITQRTVVWHEVCSECEVSGAWLLSLVMLVIGSLFREVVFLCRHHLHKDSFPSTCASIYCFD